MTSKKNQNKAKNRVSTLRKYIVKTRRQQTHRKYKETKATTTTKQKTKNMEVGAEDDQNRCWRVENGSKIGWWRREAGKLVMKRERLDWWRKRHGRIDRVLKKPDLKPHKSDLQGAIDWTTMDRTAAGWTATG
jgi:hypothetical protein